MRQFMFRFRLAVLFVGLGVSVGFEDPSWGTQLEDQQAAFCANYSCPVPQPGQTVVCKQNLGDQYFSTSGNILLVCNHINGYLHISTNDYYLHPATNVQVLYNVIRASDFDPLTDTCSTFMTGFLSGAVIKGNIMTSTMMGSCKGNSSGQEALFKNYGLQNSQVVNNEINAFGDGQLVYGLIEFRSTCRDNIITGNVLNGQHSNNVGLFTHFSNVCCNANGDMSTTIGQACNSPGTAPYNQNCHDRRNVIDSNTFVGSGFAIDFGDGTWGNTVSNNVLVGGIRLHYAANNQWIGNTIDGQDHAAVTGYVWGGSSAGVSSVIQSQFTDNILRTSGAAAINGNLSGTQLGSSSDYNLFWPSSASSEAHSISADPQFSNLQPSDALARNYSPVTGSRACNLAGPGQYVGALPCGGAAPSPRPSPSPSPSPSASPSPKPSPSPSASPSPKPSMGPSIGGQPGSPTAPRSGDPTSPKVPSSASRVTGNSGLSCSAAKRTGSMDWNLILQILVLLGGCFGYARLRIAAL